MDYFTEIIETAKEYGQKLSNIEGMLLVLNDKIKTLIEAREEECLLNKKQACQLLGVSYPTLRKLIERGMLKPVINAGVVRFSKRDILKTKSERACV